MSDADPPKPAAPWRELLSIAAPTVATMTSYTLMQFVDGLMVARMTPHDPLFLAAQGNGGVWSFVPMSIFSGLVGVVNTYVAHNLGAGRPRNGPAYAWNAMWLGLILWLTLVVPLALMVPTIFAAQGHHPRLVAMESGYAQLLMFGAPLTVVSRSCSQFFYGMHKPWITLAGAVAGNLVNLGCNYLLIYGHMGVPAMGVTGAAMGTLIGSGVEASIPLAVFLSARYHRLYGTRSAWRMTRAHLRDIARLGWPPALMFGNEIVCWAVFMTVLTARFGPEHNAAGWIVLRYMQLSFMPAVGMSVALTAVVGKYLGARRPDLAAQRAKLGIAIAMAYMGACAVVFVLLRKDMVRLFTEGDPAMAPAAQIASGLMIVAAVFQVFDGLGISMVGVLRGAGDTVFPGVVTVILSWTCIVGLGVLAVSMFPEAQSLGPWIAVAVYIVALGVALAWRFFEGSWRRKDLLAGSARSAGEPAEDAIAASSAIPLMGEMAAPLGPGDERLS